MSRVPPSAKIEKEISSFLRGNGWEDEESLISRMLYLGAQKLAQEALEQEAADFLGRDHYQRRQEGEEHLGYRNGYRQRKLDTAEGRIPVLVPQIRDSPEP